jgi:hypothetical protein
MTPTRISTVARIVFVLPSESRTGLMSESYLCCHLNHGLAWCPSRICVAHLDRVLACYLGCICVAHLNHGLAWCPSRICVAIWIMAWLDVWVVFVLPSESRTGLMSELYLEVRERYHVLVFRKSYKNYDYYDCSRITLAIVFVAVWIVSVSVRSLSVGGDARPRITLLLPAGVTPVSMELRRDISLLELAMQCCYSIYNFVEKL